MSTAWRLLDPGLLPAADNMALDKVVLSARSQNLIPDTLRFLQFTPCVLIGCHQAVELEIEEDYCRRHGVDINRRITGGGNLYMDEGVLGWEIVVPRHTPGIPNKLEDMYRMMCESSVIGLNRLGVEARFRPTNDVEVNGRKISGSGGTEIGEALLYQGTVLIDFDVDMMVNCLKLPVKKLADKQVKDFKTRVTSVKEILGCVPPLKQVKKIMADGFAEVFGIDLQPQGLTQLEQEMLAEELPRFQSREWIYGVRRYPQTSGLYSADYKTEGGLIRVSLLLDSQRSLIKYVFITGDFFAYPERAILDLEAALKNAPIFEPELSSLVHNFFIANKVRIPGVTADDIVKALLLAVNDAG